MKKILYNRPMEQTTPKSKILLTMNLGNLAILAVGMVAYYFFVYRIKDSLPGIYPPGLNLQSWLWLVCGYVAMVLIFWVLVKIKSPEYFYDEAVDLLVRSLNMPQLISVFLLGGIAEELIFRGILQLWIGIIPATLLFTVVHIRYLKKIFMILETFCLGLVLGLLYMFTDSIWICTIAHTLINLTTAWIIKSGKISYIKKDAH